MTPQKHVQSCAAATQWTAFLKGTSLHARGFGTVRYSTPEDAQGAAQIMNGAEIGGRTVTVRIDRFA